MWKRVGLKSPVRENCTPGSVRGPSGNRRSYRDGSIPYSIPQLRRYGIKRIPYMPTANVERKLAAILSADVQGYSRLMGEDEVGTLHTLTACREITDSCIAQHHGRIVNTAGDS